MADNLENNFNGMHIRDDPHTTSEAAGNTDSGIVDDCSAPVGNNSGSAEVGGTSSNDFNTTGDWSPSSCIVSVHNRPAVPPADVLKWFERDEEGDNDLFIALTNPESAYHRQVAALIIDNAPNSSLLDMRNNSGINPLIIATLKKDGLAVRRLRLAGVNPNISDYLGNTAVHYAAFYGNDNALLALATNITNDEKERYGSHRTPEILAVNLNLRNCDGKTPLHLAVDRRQKTIIEKLQEMGVDANLTENSAGRTALHVAVQLGFVDCVEVLLKIADIDVNATNYAGQTPLDHVASVDSDVRQEIERLLVRAGAEHGNRQSDSENDDDSEDMESD